MKKKIKCCTAFGIILGFLALAATVIAFATDHWIDIKAPGKSRTYKRDAWSDGPVVPQFEI